jgi:hypothetical protein
MKRVVGDMDPLPELEVQALEALQDAARKSKVLQMRAATPLYAEASSGAGYLAHLYCFPGEVYLFGHSWDVLRRSQAKALEESGLASHHPLFSYTDQICLAPWELPTADMPIFAGDPAAYQKLLVHYFERAGFERVLDVDPVLTVTEAAKEAGKTALPLGSIENPEPLRGILKTDIGRCKSRLIWQEWAPIHAAGNTKEERLVAQHKASVAASSHAAAGHASSQRIAFTNANHVTPRPPEPARIPKVKGGTGISVTVDRETEGGIFAGLFVGREIYEKLCFDAAVLNNVRLREERKRMDLECSRKRARGADTCAAAKATDSSSAKATDAVDAVAKRGHADGITALKKRKPNETLYVLKKCNRYSSWQARAFPALASRGHDAHEHEREVFTFFDKASSRNGGIMSGCKFILGRNEKKEFFNHGVMAESDLIHAYPNLYNELVQNGVYPAPDSRFYKAGLELQTRTRAELRKIEKEE